jgi:hypothetical protein
MTALDRPAIDHLIKLLGMLGSAHDGERAAAGLKAHELVKRFGLQWGDLIAMPPPAVAEPKWRAMAMACCRHLDSLKRQGTGVRPIDGGLVRHAVRQTTRLAQPPPRGPP